MGSFSLLHARATARPNEREQGLEVAMEEIRIDDQAMDEMTHGQSQARLTSLDTLLSVSNGSGAEPIPRPVSAPAVFPQSGLESTRYHVEEQAAIGSMNEPRDDRVGYVPFYLPLLSMLSSLLAWRQFCPLACAKS